MMAITSVLLLSLLLFATPGSSRIHIPSHNRLVSLEDAKLLNLEGHPLVQTSSPLSSSSPAASLSEEKKRQVAADPLADVVATVFHGEHLDFHETSIDGGFRSFSWNQDDPTRIIVLVTYTPYLSEDSGKTFIDLSSRLENFTVNHETYYGGGSGGYGVRTVMKSSVDHNYIILLGKGSTIWRSIDGGANFKLINLKAGNDALHLRRIAFHPTQKNLLMGLHIDSHCLDGSISPSDPICSIEVYISRDFGLSWTLVGTHAWLFYWGVYQSPTGVAKDSIYLLCSRDRDSHQIGNGANAILDILEVVTDDLKVITVRENVDEMLSIGEYIYIIAPPPGQNDFARLYVSHLGGPFRETSFGGSDLRGFAFVDYSEGTVLVIDAPSSVSQTYSDYRGDLWASDSTGTYFTRTLQRVLLQSTRSANSFDLHKIESLEGTYIATHLDTQAKLRSKISWNRAGSWQDVHSQAGIDGLVNEGENPFVLLGEVHANNAGSHQGFFSEQSAPGSVLAIGSYSVPFLEYIGGDSDGDVYFSRNGGKTFTKILDKFHYCSLLDEGSIIVCVPGYGASTSTFLYSLDQGTTWKSETFTAEAGDVLSLSTDPDSFGLSAIIMINTSNRVRLITVDLSQLGLPPCTEANFERWMPSDSQDERHCILGHHSIFIRPKAGANCESKLNTFLVEKVNCPCGSADFECNVGYFYNLTSASCAPEVGTPVKPINCVNGFYLNDLNYRLVPGDTCNKTAPGAVDLEADVQTECPVEHLIDENAFKHKLAVGLGVGVTFLLIIIIGAIGFVIWSKKKGYLQYRILLTNEEGGGVELDTPDHPEEDN